MKGSVHLCVREGFNDLDVNGRFSPASALPRGLRLAEAVERGAVATVHHTRPLSHRAMSVTYHEQPSQRLLFAHGCTSACSR